MGVADSVKTSMLRKTIFNGDGTGWSYDLCMITKNLDDTIPIYYTDFFRETKNEALFNKKTITARSLKN